MVFAVVVLRGTWGEQRSLSWMVCPIAGGSYAPWLCLVCWGIHSSSSLEITSQGTQRAIRQLELCSLPLPHRSVWHSNLWDEPGDFCSSARCHDVHWDTSQDCCTHDRPCLISYLSCTHTGKGLPQLSKPPVRRQPPSPHGQPLVRDVLSTAWEKSACPLTEVSTLFFHTKWRTNTHFATGSSQDCLESGHHKEKGFLREVGCFSVVSGRRDWWLGNGVLVFQRRASVEMMSLPPSLGFPMSGWRRCLSHLTVPTASGTAGVLVVVLLVATP